MRLAEMNRMIQPPPLRDIWEISEEEIFSVSEPLYESIMALPDRYLEGATAVLQFANPVTCILACVSIIAPRAAAQRIRVEQIRATYAQQARQPRGFDNPTTEPDSGDTANGHYTNTRFYSNT